MTPHSSHLQGQGQPEDHPAAPGEGSAYLLYHGVAHQGLREQAHIMSMCTRQKYFYLDTISDANSLSEAAESSLYFKV